MLGSHFELPNVQCNALLVCWWLLGFNFDESQLLSRIIFSDARSKLESPISIDVFCVDAKVGMLDQLRL